MFFGTSSFKQFRIRITPTPGVFFTLSSFPDGIFKVSAKSLKCRRAR